MATKRKRAPVRKKEPGLFEQLPARKKTPVPSLPVWWWWIN